MELQSTKGIFSLTDVIELQSKNRLGFFETNFGYFGGGSGTITVDKIDYSNDTAIALSRGQLNVGKSLLASTGNQNFGYFAGGSSPIYSTVERIEYSNDLEKASIRNPLVIAKHNLAATGTLDYGYFGGGVTAVPSVLSSIERIDYSNDTTLKLRGSLISTLTGFFNQTRYESAATGNSNFGYFAGGLTPGVVSTIERIDYSNDTVITSPRGPLSFARYN